MISNPPGRLAEDRHNHPLGVSTDLQSVVKKCPNLFMFWGFVIPSHQYCLANLILSSKNTKNIRKTYSISPKNK